MIVPSYGPHWVWGMGCEDVCRRTGLVPKAHNGWVESLACCGHRSKVRSVTRLWACGGQSLGVPIVRGDWACGGQRSGVTSERVHGACGGQRSRVRSIGGCDKGSPLRLECVVSFVTCR